MTVRKNDRRESSMAWRMEAMKIRKRVFFLLGTKAFPKRATFYVGQPLAQACNDLVNHCETAHLFFPNTPENLSERKKFMTLAMADCTAIINYLQITKETWNQLSDADMFELVEKCSNEKKRIKGARDKVVLITNKRVAVVGDKQ